MGNELGSGEPAAVQTVTSGSVCYSAAVLLFAEPLFPSILTVFDAAPGVLLQR